MTTETETNETSAETPVAETSTTEGAERGNRGPRRGNDRDRRPREDRRPRDDRRPNHARGPRVDNSPPRFDPTLLVELAGAPLWQASHDAAVTDVTDVAVFVEVRPKGHPALRAAVPAKEFASDIPQVGTSLRVRLLNPPSSSESVPAASVKQAMALDLFDALLAAQSKGEALKGTIAAVVKGGFAVDISGTEVSSFDGKQGASVRAFLPRSQGIHPKLHADGDAVGETDVFDVVELDAERSNIVLTRRKRLDEAVNAASKARMAEIKVGDEVDGVVKSIVAFGAFVDIGGVDALLHASDISWDRTPRVSNVLRVGEHIRAKVIVCEPGEKRIKIGMKQLIANPWEDLKATLKKGSIVEGDVVSLQDYGAFVRIADGVEGLVHVSEASWERLKHVSQKLHIGDRVKAKVLDVDAANHRVSLSIRAAEPNPFEVVRDKYPPGTVLKVKVRSLTDFGAFVSVDDTVDGLIHVGEISWLAHVNHPSEVLTIGQEVEVVVLDIDVARQRVSCSMKQLTENPWKAWEQKYTRGSRHTLKVTRVDNYGITFEVPEKDLSATCGSRDASPDDKRPGEVCKNGDMLEVEVKTLDKKSRRVVVSLKAVLENDTRQAYDEYKQKEKSQARMTLGDALKDKLGKAPTTGNSEGES
jgi:small subunit ribosomal protein S1